MITVIHYSGNGSRKIGTAWYFGGRIVPFDEPQQLGEPFGKRWGSRERGKLNLIYSGIFRHSICLSVLTRVYEWKADWLRTCEMRKSCRHDHRFKIHSSVRAVLLLGEGGGKGSLFCRVCLLTRLPHLKCIRLGWFPCVQVTFHLKCIKLVACVIISLY